MGMIKNEDAQFMLLAGFIVAIGLVITTVMLNNIIFEGNMAGEAGADQLKYDVVNLMRISADEMRNAYRSANGTNESQKKDNFTIQMKNFSSNLQIVYALHGQGVNVSWNISNWNSSIGAQFTENGIAIGASNWTVIENVRNSTINVNITSINPSSPFRINITNTTKYWHINFTATGKSIINDSQIRNNITFPYSISFINGSTTFGNYSISGNISNNKYFNRSRDYNLNSTITLSNSRIRANVTFPVSVPW